MKTFSIERKVREKIRVSYYRVILCTDANYVNYGVTARYKYPRTVSWGKKGKVKVSSVRGSARHSALHSVSNYPRCSCSFSEENSV